MFKHYITIALRNLLKYRSQSIISIIGLAVGFTCFALSTLWIRYELTYDNFHEDADQMYLVRIVSNTNDNGLSEITPYPLAGYLKKTFPEIEKACNMQAWDTKFKYKQVEHESFQLSVDSATMDMFQIQLISGSPNFMIRESNEVGITERLAQQLFGTESPLGKEIEVFGEKKTICATIKNWSSHSNMPFELIEPNGYRAEWGVSSWRTFIKVRKGIDIKAFEKKLFEHKIKEEENAPVKSIVLTPITSMRYDRPGREETIKFSHIQLFAVAGGLVILCSLFNFLTLFVTRIRMRGKEIALRKVCGSSNRNLLALLAIEYLLILLLALLIGMILTNLILPTFKELSEIKANDLTVYAEAVGYSSAIACLSFLISLFPIYYFRRQSLNATMKGSSDGKGRNVFQHVSMVSQLIISIGFIFCSSILMKQIQFLNNTNLGMERKGRASVFTYPSIDGLKEELGRIPTVTEVFPDSFEPLFPRQTRMFQDVKEWDDKPASIQSVTLEIINCNKAFCDFYGLHILEGKMPDANSSNQILLNEAAIKELGINNPIGKTIQAGTFTISGVIRDFYIAPPTVPVKPILLTFKEDNYRSASIIFKYQENQWNTCKQQLEKLIKKMNPNILHSKICDLEEEYQKFLKSENALLKMLDFVTLVCIIISLFGVFSLVTLDCERQRKGIAVRKVNGATTSDIIRIFLHKYVLLLCVAAAVAFPIGYLIMKSWIESYVLQTTIDLWIYPVILLAIALIVALCTGWRIWRAANQNPAEVIKSE